MSAFSIPPPKKSDEPYLVPSFQELIRSLNLRNDVVELGSLITSWDRGDGPRDGYYTDDLENGVVFLRINNLVEHTVDYSDAKRITRVVHETDLRRTQSKPGDLIFAISGTKQNLGTVAIVPQSLRECNLNSALVNLRIDESRLSKEFFCWFFESQTARTQLDFIGKGAAQNNINNAEISEILIPLPSSPKQRELVAAMDAARAERRAKLAEADALLAGLDGFLVATLGLTPPPEDARKVFAVRSRNVPQRFDPHFYLPSLMQNTRMLAEFGAEPLGTLVSFSDEVWKPAAHDNPTFRYIEISDVNPQTGEARAETRPVAEAPSRARMAVRTNDIIVSLTRPHHGSIAQITPELNGCVASTGFSVLRNVSERMNREYLWCVLRTKMSLKQMLQRASGGNYPAITEQELAKVLLPVPKPAVQETIAAEAGRRREEARGLRAEADAGWQAAKRWFEEQLLGAAHP